MLSSSEKQASLVWTWKGQPYSLPITSLDVLNLARAIEHEGPPENGVAWALIQRAAWLMTLGKHVTLGGLVQEYAQPINPAWFPNGAKHAAEIARLTRIGDKAGIAAETAHAKQRPIYAAETWDELSPSTKDLVQSILNGSSKSPVIGAVHYSETRGSDFASNQAKYPDFILLDVGYGFHKTNVFFAVRGSETFGGIRVANGASAWPGDTPIESASMVTGPVTLALVLAGVLAWKWIRP